MTLRLHLFPGSGGLVAALEDGQCMSRECLLAGGRLLGVTRRYPQTSVAAICTRTRPLGDSIAVDGLSEAVLFLGSLTGLVLPDTFTLSASHNPFFWCPPYSVGLSQR